MLYNYTNDDVPSKYQIYWLSPSYCATLMYSYNWPQLNLNGSTIVCATPITKYDEDIRRFLIVETVVDDLSFSGFVSAEARNESYFNRCNYRCKSAEFVNHSEYCLYLAADYGVCIPDKKFSFKSQKITFQEEREKPQSQLRYLGLLALLLPVVLLVLWVVYRNRKPKRTAEQVYPESAAEVLPPDKELPPYSKSEAQVLCKLTPDV